MNEQLARLREWYEKLAPRERKLMNVLGVALVAFALVLGPLGVSLMLSSRRAENKALTEAIFAIKNAREDVRQRQAKRDAVIARYANKAPALASVFDKAARDNHIDIQNSQDLPDVPHGKKYVERATVVRLRKVAMLPLAKMLEQLEQQHMPIAISRFNIRRRGGEKDSYDVELGLSAYDRNEPAPKEKETGTAPSAGSGGSK
jgi:general secretion pathway protein M